VSDSYRPDNHSRAASEMSTSMIPPVAPPAKPVTAYRLDPAAAFLSYVVPGLGQIAQGRVGKGLLFLVSLYALFAYGMFLGRWSNVFLADTAGQNPPFPTLPRLVNNLYNRPHFAGQFWIGAAAWPAIWHYWHQDPNKDRGTIDNRKDFFARFEMAPSERELNELQRDGDKHWDLGWVYTVIAGVLNVLVIYDALAGPAFGSGTAKSTEEKTRS
jgi:TM2 domain-containing membrane protein YozV